jgi:expansin (peptidoglycan-binding protein)
VPITWHYVECDVEGPIRYHFKDGSNQWWSAIQIRNHRHAIRSFAYRDEGGEYVDVARESYNYFVEPAGMGPGPHAFRVTDVHGNVLEDEGIEFVEDGEVEGAAQFPPCE